MLAALGVLVVAMAVMGVSDAGWVRWLAVASFGAFFVFWLTTRYGRAWLLVIAVVIAAAFVAQRLLG